MIKLTDKEFETLVKFVYDRYGINLAKKRVLIEGRLSNTLIEKGMTHFSQYMDLLFNDKTGNEVTTFLNKITTNHTYFLREYEHFDYMQKKVLPFFEEKFKNTRDVRIWSAACSSGQEPYTIAMVIDEYFGSRKSQWDTTILATDISMRALDKAKKGIYTEEEIKDIPKHWVGKYLIDKKDGTFEICPKIKKEVVFRTGNLMEPFSVKKPFDLIFCRNVMIYFDAPTKEKLINKFYDVTAKDGFLFIGHSEVINKETTKYTYLQPAIYQRRS